MAAATLAEARLVSALPGRARLRAKDVDPQAARALESSLAALPGVERADVNPSTGGILVRFDPNRTRLETILRALRVPHAQPPPPAAPTAAKPRRVHTLSTGRRLRISVPGIEGRPGKAVELVERLQRHPDVEHASASPLTSRLLVVLSADCEGAQDVLSAVLDVDLPDVPEVPRHPLDVTPLVDNAARLGGAALGLAGLGLARALRRPPPAGQAAAAGVAAVISTIEAFPPLRSGLERLIGARAATTVATAAGVASLTLAGSPLGLALTAAMSLRVLSEGLARRRAWLRYEHSLDLSDVPTPGSTVRLQAGSRVPYEGEVVDGSGTGVGADGMPEAIRPGDIVASGTLLHGGPFLIALGQPEDFEIEPRAVPPRADAYDRYLDAVAPAALAYAAAVGLRTRSLRRALISFLLVNPRPAVIGAEAADLDAAARALRAGAVVALTRHGRTLRRPDTVLLGELRSLTHGFEVVGIRPLVDAVEPEDLLRRAAGVAAAARAPWASAFPRRTRVDAEDGRMEGAAAAATIAGSRYRLEQLDDSGDDEVRLRLTRGDDPRPLADVLLRLRPAEGAEELVATCRRLGVRLLVLAESGARLAVRVGVEVLEADDAAAAVRALQADGSRVAFLGDGVHAAGAFAACDLALGLAPEHGAHFLARADVLVPDLATAAGVVEATGQRQRSARDSIVLSLAANAGGAFWGLRGDPGVVRASAGVQVAALAALGDGWLRLRGGARPRALVDLLDPEPERWGERSPDEILRELESTASGLSSAAARKRRQSTPRPREQVGVAAAIADQVRSPLTLVLGAAAAASFALGAIGDVAVIASVIVADVAVGAWQEREAGRAAAMLARMSAPRARVLRDGRPSLVPAPDVVRGDVLMLESGDRVAADARLIAAADLEVDEAALTGESLPVAKSPSDETAAGRVILAGSDVVVGTGRAVAVAVGRETRLGTIAAALELAGRRESKLGTRLEKMLRQLLPLAAVGGLIVTAAGALRRRPLVPQLALGATIAIAAVPEGLPLLTGVAEAAVARRLARRKALVRRLAAVEALGRVDVACVDKTGTLTEGRLTVATIVGADGQRSPEGGILRAAALASPHPDAAGAAAHATDRAVLAAAEEAGLDVRTAREAEVPFDPARGYHASQVEGRVFVKGAPELVAERCRGDTNALLAIGRDLADRGLRVLLVATGEGGDVDDPRDLTPLGFVGIADPLRPGVSEAVARCRAAGIRVMMLTGDHPATARSVGEQAGIVDGGDVVLASELLEAGDDELAARLEQAVVVARMTPIDKLQIVRRLQGLGHTVAMTGDGINDGPALRLADVGVAMGRGGTEVARAAADVVVADDDFSTLVDALVEGRSFWQNVRRALALLLGGNLGELGLMVAASALGRQPPLTPREILAVNVVTDVLPAVAVAVQQPRTQDLSGLAREGVAGLGEPLRAESTRRGIATAVPTLAAFLLAERQSGAGGAQSVAFGGIVATQLAQTLDAGRRADGTVTASVAAGVAASAALAAAALAVPPLRAFLGLTAPAGIDVALILAAAALAVALARTRRSSPAPAPALPAAASP